MYTPKRGIEWIDLPPRLQETVTRSHAATVRRIAGGLSSFGYAATGVTAAAEALVGFGEAIRPYKKRRLFDSFPAMEVDGAGSSGAVFAQRKRKWEPPSVLGSKSWFKEKKLASQYVTLMYRGIGTSEWGGYEDKQYYGPVSNIVTVSTIGQYPMLNLTNCGVIGAGNANRRRHLLPVYGFSLTNTPNNTALPSFNYPTNIFNGFQLRRDVIGTTNNFHGFYPLYLYGNEIGSSVITNSLRATLEDGSRSNTIDADGAKREIWTTKFRNMVEQAMVPHDFGILTNVNIKLDLWGAKKAPTTWKIMLVQFPETEGPEYTNPLAPPNGLGSGLDSQYAEYDGVAGTSKNAATLHKQMWNPLTNHPWCVDSVPHSSKLRVLWSRVLSQAPTWENDEDDRPHNLLLNYNIRMNRQCRYNWLCNNTITNQESTANSIEVINNTDINVDVHPNARVYLIVQCDNYKRESCPESGPVTFNDNYIPSFNVQITKTNEIGRRG